MKKFLMIVFLGLLLSNCAGQETGRPHLGLKGSDAFYLTASKKDIKAYEEERILEYVNMSVANICIEWDSINKKKIKKFMSIALERKGEDPLKCRK